MRDRGLIAALGMVGLLAAPAWADDAADQCVNQAKATFKTCRSDCIVDYKEARFSCRGVDPACGIPCLEAKRECVDVAKQPLTTCVEGCQAALRATKDTCRTVTCPPPDSAEREACLDACIDPAQVTAFVCRDQCREDFRRNQTAQDTLKACKTGFKACIEACAPPPAP